MHTGTCLCGSISYTVTGELGPLTFCHCSRCRKANGTAFLAAVAVDPDKFILSDPDGNLASYESSPGVYRKFCGRCGSPLYSHRPGPPEAVRVRIGTLDTPYREQPKMHIYYGDRAAWFCVGGDEAPRYDERP